MRLLSSEAQQRKDFRKSSKPCHVGIHWIVLAEYYQMSTNMPGFFVIFQVFHNFVMAKLVLSDEYECAMVSVICQVFSPFVLAKLATSSIIRVKGTGTHRGHSVPRNIIEKQSFVIFEEQ